MNFLTSAEVHDCISDFSSSMTAALHANSMVARRPKRVFANGHTAVNPLVRCFRYWLRIALGALACASARGDRRTNRIASPATMWMILRYFGFLSASTHVSSKRELPNLNRPRRAVVWLPDYFQPDWNVSWSFDGLRIHCATLRAAVH